MALDGQFLAASTILASSPAFGSNTTATPSSSSANTPGTAKVQLPDPMHVSRSISISSGT